MTRRSSIPTPPPTLRLREPIDVLAAVPYLVGYHPSDSVVVLAMHGKQLIFTARDDLPPQVDELVRVVQRQGATGVLLVGYGPAKRADPAVTELRAAFARAELAVLEVLRADGGRYWSYLCTDLACCPVEGSPYDAAASVVPAQAALAGRVALPDRAAFETQIRPVGGLARVSMAQATARASDRLFELVTRPIDERELEQELLSAGSGAVDQALRRQEAGARLDDDEVAWLTVLLVSIPVRDTAWARITGPPERLERHRDLWLDVMRRAEADLRAGPGCLFAFASWRCGEGGLARLALEKVLDIEPEYSMARLLHHALSNGVPPSALDEFPLSGPDRRRPAGPRPRRRSSSRRARTRRG